MTVDEDGSPDDTQAILAPFLDHPTIYSLSASMPTSITDAP